MRYFFLAVATRSSCERSGVVCRALVAAQPGADPPRSQTADLKAEKPTPARKSGTPSLPKTITCRLPSGASLGPQHDSYLLAHGVGRRGARTAKLIYSATEPGPQKTGPLKPHLRRSSDRTGPTLRSLADIRQKVSNPLRRCLHFDVPRAPKTHHLFIPARKSTPGSGKADSTLCQITPSSTNLKTPCAKTASGRTRL